MAQLDEDSSDNEYQVSFPVYLSFYKPLPAGKNRLRCIVCGGEPWYNPKTTERSSFWLDGTRCTGGHRQARLAELQESTTFPGVCASCDQTFMLDVINGRRKCRRDGCDRVLRIHKSEVKKVMSDEPEELEAFMNLVASKETFECSICMTDVEYKTQRHEDSRLTKECQHKRDVCDDCLKMFLEGLIGEGKIKDLVCPNPGCKTDIPADRIRDIVDSKHFKLYTKKSAMETMLKRNPKFRWCSCGHGQIHGPGDSLPEYHCSNPKCKLRHCFSCPDKNNPGIPNSTCSHLRLLDQQRKDDRLKQRTLALQLVENKSKAAFFAVEKEDETISIKKRTTKTCPRQDCGTEIERFQERACTHFTCPDCKTEFCWSCKVMWKIGKTEVAKKAQHLRTCQFEVKTIVEKSALNLRYYTPKWDVDDGYDVALDKDLTIMSWDR